MATGSARAGGGAHGGAAGDGVGADGGGPRGACGGTGRATGDGAVPPVAAGGDRARRGEAAGAPSPGRRLPHAVVVGGRLPRTSRRAPSWPAGARHGRGEPTRV